MSWKFWRSCHTGTEADRSAPGLGPAAVLPGDTRPLPHPQPAAPGAKRPQNPCERCGACCAFFLVAFPVDEAPHSSDNLSLETWSLPLDETRRFMKGTEMHHPRCHALQGTIGSRVSCLIYANRSSTCRNFTRSWENNIGNTLCDKARAVFGLEPFSQY